ncbi:hypothetical protein Tco_1164025 [Tanacetum coccineum]
MDIHEGGDESVLSTQEYIKKVVEDEDEDFKSGSWVSATEYVNANGDIVIGCLGDIKNFLKNGKLEQVVAIIKSCTPNALGDLILTMKDLSGTISDAIHHKFINEGGYRKDIILESDLILANVSVFSPKPSMLCLGRIWVARVLSDHGVVAMSTLSEDHSHWIGDFSGDGIVVVGGVVVGEVRVLGGQPVVVVVDDRGGGLVGYVSGGYGGDWLMRVFGTRGVVLLEGDVEECG